MLPRETGRNYKRTTILKSLEMILGHTANDKIFIQENLQELSKNRESVVIELGCASSPLFSVQEDKNSIPDY